MNRLTVVESVYHQEGSKKPSSVLSRFARNLKTDEQPYVRRVLISPKSWVPLDTGWVEEVGMLVISNEGTNAVEVGNMDSSVTWIIHPGESMRGCPSKDAKNISLRCPEGQSKCLISVFPS